MLMRTSQYELRSNNLLLRALSSNDSALLCGRVERLELARGATLFSSDEVLDSLYFPESAVLSIERETGDRGHIETALVGFEGMVGWSALMGGAFASHNAVVQMHGGTVLRIAVAEIRASGPLSAALMPALLAFVDVIMVQMAQAIVSHSRDTADRRVCRWLLMRHDRMSSDHIRIHHDEIAGNLGIRRATVTDCLHILEGDRLVRCHRGRIVVRDRAALQERAAGSYGVPEARYRDLLGRFGKTQIAGSATWA